jgi:phosphonoacetate hydrolase
MPRTTVIICVDGFDPEYLEACKAPTIEAVAAKGFQKIGRSMMPSVTNVNNVSLVTASYPETHGINSNYWLRQETGEEFYMESAEFVLAETMFQRAERLGKNSILLTSKDKLRALLSVGATVAMSSEAPADWVVKTIGEPPPIYSLEVNGWVVRAAVQAMSRCEADVVYITTTDYAMHMYPPDDPHSKEHMTILDNAIGELLDAYPDVALLITADHGMSSKSRMVDPEAALGQYGIRARAVPIIKDRYTVHHSNLGGCAFVYLDGGDPQEALKVLRSTAGVEEALSKEEAVAELKLHSDRLGDFVVMGEKDVVFGNPNEVEMPAGLRSHASLHERRIPLIGFNGEFQGFEFEENRDIGRYVFERVLSK